jgi:hypothetical protein
MAITEDGSIPCTDETRADPLVCTASFPWPSITGTLVKQRVKDQIKKNCSNSYRNNKEAGTPLHEKKKTLLHYNNTQVFQTKKQKSATQVKCTILYGPKRSHV